MADIKVTDLLGDIKEFSGELKDINKFISSCKAWLRDHLTTNHHNK